ncbi:MAG: efflux RND transporter periplasmic adaptor subunit [Candidatus Omnitrophica bacterium]|nr:efflux RND transporter periplasmic adaptor subunit [Candidatus Omnitrophota bacterium]MDD5311201.1 efflux RND transporter periplasmic adaptor subunit [Candidatus Omnitrophota bacterium]MDD5546132.1 efflux RND transporter periplasmic adaptor subunit [Candidatus Omnitrophota bacterium]
MKTSNKKWKVFLVIIIVIGIAAFFFVRSKIGSTVKETTSEITAATGPIQSFISTTGTVLPQNRLGLKPPVAVRVEKILVREGDMVKTGQTLAWMSSTERAAVLDAARGKGEAELKYWEDAYKAIPLLAPIDGEIIVATVQPGQTLTTADAVLVLSDRLIVRAQVDETDIGKIKLGQPATVSLDAFPESKVNTTVGHIYYESQTVNNVTIYNVDLVPESVPAFFRSGMNANIDFLEQKKEDALLLPNEAVHKDKEGSYVLLSRGPEKEPVRQAVTTGISDDLNTEILSGITAGEKIVVKAQKYALPTADTATNPFMPSRNKSSNKK